MKRFLTLGIAFLFTVLLVISVTAGGTQADNGGSGPKLTVKLSPDEPFNPDSADGMDAVVMRQQYGPVPKLDFRLRLGAVAKAFENEYWRILREGYETSEDKWQERGYDISVDVRSAQGEGDEQGQLAIVKDMINKKYTALLLSPISDGNLVPGVEDAARAGIPVLNVNDGIINIAPNFVGPRAIQNGELAAEWMAKEIGNKGKTAIVIGMPKAFAARQRTIGFENWMKENAPDVEIVEKQNADWSREKARDLAEIWIKKYPDIDGIFCNNDIMALGVQEAVNSSGKDILVVGVDGIGEAYDSIRKGEMDATIDSFPFYKAQFAIEVILRILGGQELPRVVWTPQALIDSTNVDTLAPEIINWEEPAYE